MASTVEPSASDVAASNNIADVAKWAGFTTDGRLDQGGIPFLTCLGGVMLVEQVRIQDVGMGTAENISEALTGRSRPAQTQLATRVWWKNRVRAFSTKPPA